MSDNQPNNNVLMNTTDNGSVIFATDVISTIAGLAATEVEGVTNMVGASGTSFSELFSRKNQSSKALTKGVKVELMDGNKVTVSLTIVVDYGSPIPEVAGNIQENVKKAIETMSGLTVSAVNVHVSAVSFAKEQKTVAEIEEKQKLMLQQREADETRETASKEDAAVENASKAQREPEQPSNDAPVSDAVNADQTAADELRMKVTATSC